MAMRALLFAVEVMVLYAKAAPVRSQQRSSTPESSGSVLTSDSFAYSPDHHHNRIQSPVLHGMAQYKHGEAVAAPVQNYTIVIILFIDAADAHGQLEASAKQAKHLAKETKTNYEHGVHRGKKAIELGLHQYSAMPMFAHYLPLEELKKHPQLDNWRKHLDQLSKGHITASQLPPHFKSSRSGYTLPDGTKIGGVSEKKISERSKQPRSARLQDQKAIRRQKAQALKLHRDSGLPVFAQGIPVGDIKGHKDIDDWHHHRRQLQSGAITEKDLPDHFKPLKGRFKLQKAVDEEGLPIKTKIRKSSATESDHEGGRSQDKKQRVEEAASSPHSPSHQGIYHWERKQEDTDPRHHISAASPYDRIDDQGADWKFLRQMLNSPSSSSSSSPPSTPLRSPPHHSSFSYGSSE